MDSFYLFHHSKALIVPVISIVFRGNVQQTNYFISYSFMSLKD